MVAIRMTSPHLYKIECFSEVRFAIRMAYPLSKLNETENIYFNFVSR
jgi:hypothetical protein